MGILTVRGAVEKEEIGICLPHEHLQIDLRGLVEKPDPKENRFFYEPLTLENRWRIYSDPYTLLDNALLKGDRVLRELSLSAECEIRTIVDVTPPDVGRNAQELYEISRQSGTNIVMGCGHYIDAAVSPQVKKLSEKELAEEMIKDLRFGADNTQIRAGVIGEIGTSAEITDFEWKSVRAAGVAALETGAGIHVHTSLWEENGLSVANLLIDMGVRPEKICIDHIDVELRSEYLYKLADLGVLMEFDNFGKEYYISKRNRGILKGRFAYDLERCRVIADLVQRGWEKQILLSNDICLKSMLCSYGGNGYAHVVRNIIPMLKDVGLSDSAVKNIFIGNPAEFLNMEEL